MSPSWARASAAGPRRGLFRAPVREPDRIEHASEQEKLLTTFGVADTDYTLDAAGNPVATSKSFFNAPLPFMYVTQGLAVTYAAGAQDQDQTRASHQTLGAWCQPALRQSASELRWRSSQVPRRVQACTTPGPPTVTGCR